MMDIYLKLRDPDEIDSSSRSTGYSPARRSISSPALGARASVGFGDRGLDSSSREHWRFVGSSGIVEYQGSRRHTCCIVSSRFCVGLRVFYGPILFGPCYSLALLQCFLILLIYQIHAATTLRFVVISLSLAAMTIKSLQYNNHIATPLVFIAISKLPFPTIWYASQQLCFHLQ